MKTGNNVQKAILKPLAVILSLVLVSVTVAAQDFWKELLENSSFAQIAMAMTETGGKVSHANVPDRIHSDAEFMATYLVAESEEPLELETWMTNDAAFGGALFLEQVTDEPLELETWMATDENFKVEVPENSRVTKERKTEAAMIKNSNYGNRKFILSQVNEERLKLEGWMVDSKYWR